MTEPTSAVCYEAGPCDYTLHRHLRKLGVACDVIAPSLIPKKSGDRIKTNRPDARKLASQYRAGLLTPLHVPDEDQEALWVLDRSARIYTATIKRRRRH